MALIKFSTMEDSFSAIANVHNEAFGGRKIQISFTKSKVWLYLLLIQIWSFLLDYKLYNDFHKWFKVGISHTRNLKMLGSSAAEAKAQRISTIKIRNSLNVYQWIFSFIKSKFWRWKLFGELFSYNKTGSTLKRIA